MVSFVHCAGGMRQARLIPLLIVRFLLAGGSAWAASEESVPRVDSEAELRALYEDGVLSEEAFETLRELLRTGVDPRTATREELYALPGLTWAQVDALLEHRERTGRRVEPEALVEAGVLTVEQLRRLRPFLVEEGAERSVSGRLRLLTAYAAMDGEAPPMLLHARLEGPSGWRGGGVTTLTRRRLGMVRYEPRSGALSAEPPGLGMHLPKLYVRWEGERASVLVGSYRLGFAQRLTLDTTGRPAPDGFVPDEEFLSPGMPERRCPLSGGGESCLSFGSEGRVTPDFRWTEGFRGVAGTVRGQVEGVALSLTGFGSYQSRGLNQYELFDRALCADPRSSSRACRAPDVLALRTGETASDGARFLSRSLPDVLRELAGGGHLTVGFSPRAKVGVTGWGAWPVWAVEGVALDFQEHARYPEGGGFGAVGVDAAWGTGPVDLFFEGARSFDGIAGRGGGFGALQRTVLGDGWRELEVVLRYYGRDFANPYTRAVSSADEFEGLRARNELGARVRYLHRTEDEAWRLSGTVDVWTQPPGGAAPGTVQARASARVDAVVMEEFQPSLWVEHRDKDLGRDGRGLCFEGSEGTRPGGEPIPCAGARYLLGGRVRWEPDEALVVVVQYQHALVDSREHPEGFQRDGRAVLDVRLRPSSSLRVHGRASWQDEDLSERTRLTQMLRASLEVAWEVLSELGVRARYEWVLDLKAPEGARTPPELAWHLFRLELEGRF